MKNIFLTLSLFLCVITNAQTTEPAKPEKPAGKWGIGVNASAVIPIMFEVQKDNDFEQNVGWAVGVPINYSLGRYASLEFRPSVRHESVYNTYAATDIVGNPIGEGKSTLITTTFITPLMVDIHNPEYLQGHVYAGGFASLLLKSGVRHTGPSLFDGQDGNAYFDNTDYNYENGQWLGGGFNVGGGLGYHPGNFAVVVQYMYYHHLDDFYHRFHSVGVNVMWKLNCKK